jgi:retron-type reverse transcriptase
VVILDFSKAFDTVPHDKLMYKLEIYGIKGDLHKWLTSFLTKREMRVLIEGEQSYKAVVESGVPQGTVLGPLLCNVCGLRARYRTVFEVVTHKSKCRAGLTGSFCNMF